MSLWPLLVAAVVLSLERICYVWIWRAPDVFRAFCARPAVAGQPVDVVQKLFYGFKGLQLAVFSVGAPGMAVYCPCRCVAALSRLE